jgi:hypothetical protein
MKGTASSTKTHPTYTILKDKSYIIGSTEEYKWFIELAETQGCLWDMAREYNPNITSRPSLYREGGGTYLEITTGRSDIDPNRIGLYGGSAFDNLEEYYDYPSDVYILVSDVMEASTPTTTAHNLEEAIQPRRYFFIAGRAEYDKFIDAAENVGFVWEMYRDIPPSEREDGYQAAYLYMMIESGADHNGNKVLIVGDRSNTSMQALVATIDRDWGTDKTRVFISEYM